MGLIIPSGNTPQLLIKVSIIISFLIISSMLIHKEPSNSASDQIRFDKLVAEDSFREVCR